MNPATQAVICGRRRQQVTETFMTNAGWAAPITTSRIENASGKGVAGAAGTPATPVQKTEYQYGFYKKSGGIDYETAVVDGWPKGSSYYCDPYRAFDNNPDYSGYYVCYRPYTDYVGGSGPTTGAAATAFGQDFPGGTGGPAQTTSINNIAITPGATYTIVVPAGGSLTITYFK
jgi:hypothetical protein